jgi:hypothetical protein
MHRYRIVAQISLILSILNLVLAAPIVVQEIHEARGDEMVVAEDVPAMPKKWTSWRQHRTGRRLRAHPRTRWHLRSIRLCRTGRRLQAILPRICRRIRRIQAIRGCWTGRRV